MSVKRIQKLLFSEYCDFKDMVLIETPFVQTTREGKGIRQVHLGLTPTKFILAADLLPPVEQSTITFLSGIDPEIETFELIAIYPIECVNMSIFKRRKRQVLKARFCNNRLLYFELGGFENRHSYWTLWCEKVKFLSPEYSGSSHSETSVAASSSSSSTYLIDKKEIRKTNGSRQIWYQFGFCQDPTSKIFKNDKAPHWTDRYLYLGENFEEHPYNYRPIMSPPTLSQFLDVNKKEARLYPSVNQFSSTTNRNINTCLSSLNDVNMIEMENQLEQAVNIWEISKELNHNCRIRHRRRYGFVPQPLLLNGLGSWNITPGTCYSIQMKRIPSAVNARRPPIEPELQLPITKRQLLTTISCKDLCDNSDIIGRIDDKGLRFFERTQMVFFWTPDYWYRPMSAKNAYLELQTYLNQIRNRRNQTQSEFPGCKTISEKIRKSNDGQSKSTGNKRKFSIFNSNKNKKNANIGKDVSTNTPTVKKESALEFLKRTLCINTILTAWDFNSTTLSEQLTIIDRDLFIKITAKELKIILRQKSTRNAPNISTFIAFAHRITCLVATDILRDDCKERRAQLITRFINVAYKCYRLLNFHSCRIIIYSLQMPAIYRLKSTWNYVRRKHSSRYLIFEFLCKFFGNCYQLPYQNQNIQSNKQAFMPFIGDVVAMLFDKTIDLENINSYRMMYDERFLWNAIDFLRNSQSCASRYAFNCDHRAHEYLLKARYKEEKENFYHSIKMESSYY